MKKVWFFVAALVIGGLQAYAEPLEDWEQNLQRHGVDRKQLDALLKTQATLWDKFTPQEKQTLVKGTILLMHVESFEDEESFRQHIQEMTQCMDTGAHGLDLLPEENAMIPLIECAARIHRLHCTACEL